MTITARRLERGDTDHELIWSSVALVSLAGLWLYAQLPGAPPLACPFHAITGWPCVTCGGTRAMLALMRGAIGEAFVWNPLVASAGLAAVPYLVYAIVTVMGGLPRLHVRLDARDWSVLRISTVAVVTATWAFLIVAGR